MHTCALIGSTPSGMTHFQQKILELWQGKEEKGEKLLKWIILLIVSRSNNCLLPSHPKNLYLMNREDAKEEEASPT